MQKVIQREIDEADVLGKFLDVNQLAATREFVSDGNKRLDAVTLIANNASYIVSDAVTGMIYDNKQLIEPGGNCYPNRRLAACIRDGEIILRYICYAFLAGDPGMMAERCLKQLAVTYSTLGVPLDSLVVALQKMKIAAAAIVTNQVPLREAEVTLGDCSNLAAEVANYFDQATDIMRASMKL